MNRRDAIKNLTGGVAFGFMTGSGFKKISDSTVVDKWHKYCSKEFPGMLEGETSLTAKFLDGMIRFIFDEIRK